MTNDIKFEIRKAERRKARLRLGISGVSGSGKTYSSLILATGMDGSICVIDTESRSADLYANDFDYSVIELAKPYTPERYVNAIKAAEDAGFDIIIIDSLSHAWAGEGGALDMQTNAVRMQKGSKNSYTAWADVTPEHNKLVHSLLTSKSHIIATMRSKTHYDLLENEHGKKVPVKLGLEPIQRSGMEYEFTVVLDIDMQNYATPSKDRTKLFKGKSIILTKDDGAALLNWLETGKDEEEEIKNEIIDVTDDFKNKYKLCESEKELKELWDNCWPVLAKYQDRPEVQKEMSLIKNLAKTKKELLLEQLDLIKQNKLLETTENGV